MSITHHFSKYQARQFCAEFGIDWHWSYSIDERDPAFLEMEKFGRYFSRVKVKRQPLPASQAQDRASGAVAGVTEIKVNGLS